MPRCLKSGIDKDSWRKIIYYVGLWAVTQNSSGCNAHLKLRTFRVAQSCLPQISKETSSNMLTQKVLNLDLTRNNHFNQSQGFFGLVTIAFVLTHFWHSETRIEIGDAVDAMRVAKVTQRFGHVRIYFY